MLGLKISNLLYQERASCQVKGRKKKKKTATGRKKAFIARNRAGSLAEQVVVSRHAGKLFRFVPKRRLLRGTGPRQFRQLWSRTPAKTTSENPEVLPAPGRRAPMASLDPTPSPPFSKHEKLVKSPQDRPRGPINTSRCRGWAAELCQRARAGNSLERQRPALEKPPFFSSEARPNPTHTPRKRPGTPAPPAPTSCPAGSSRLMVPSEPAKPLSRPKKRRPRSPRSRPAARPRPAGPAAPRLPASRPGLPARRREAASRPTRRSGL